MTRRIGGGRNRFSSGSGFEGVDAPVASLLAEDLQPVLLLSAPPALSMARVVCFCHFIVAMISSSVVPPSRRSIAITWLILLPSRGAAVFATAAAAGAFGAATTFLRASHCSWRCSGDSPSKARASIRRSFGPLRARQSPQPPPVRRRPRVAQRGHQVRQLQV